ncbi:LINE-1 reverse transcriptase isogeny [Gossypium australe]|uniref:LINE-1 reverse transcriptase isogeny n=1 Tax=Gossypium australe TaxID=47621 RepID=A0A5B6UZU9_9ROSI|nr:LINE-1 reverse transcriptase isogeny [Gossypium australe]
MKPTLVFWGDCCRPLDFGDLELRSLLGFQILTNAEALWVQLLRNKYSVQGVWLDVIANVFKSLGDGRLTNFWNDVWGFYISIGQQEDTLRVCDLVSSSGGWDWPRLHNLLLDSVVKLIAAVVPPSLM